MSFPIVDGRMNFGRSLNETLSFYQSLADRFGVRLPPLDRISPVAPIPARIDHGRWIVDCPDCRGAEFVFLDQPIFICMSCFNAAIGGEWRRIALPPNRGAIERALRVRPMRENRNWDPGDTIDRLQADNLEHGLPTEEAGEP